ncbi:uncharacterized protein STEHIDRAFT_168461 [Stereum hirsutum FP-91666 SS1]|uniref:uncharacterized protein n=1 Tax=Stereum hirsutum (strain FP-91666) TaxID=721885 RepID=UPI000440BCC9|nr:uncharacterized protein STEHIDRAFT_168461 [Stereum hirsutum FP-91666 SS1]EIM86475.1 hypothetical protein STEHIDRAFT_168461 [Stereum hirsutum FP-91666 SS1]
MDSEDGMATKAMSQDRRDVIGSRVASASHCLTAVFNISRTRLSIFTNSTIPTSPGMQSFGVTRTPRRPSRLGQISYTPDTDDTDEEGMETAALNALTETPKRPGSRWEHEVSTRPDPDKRMTPRSFSAKLLFHGDGLKSPEHRLLRKLKKEAHSPTLNIELAVRALSPVNLKVAPKSPVRSSRFTPYASSPLRSHVRSASSSPPPEVPSDPFLDYGHESTLESARCKPSSVGPVRHKKFTKSGAAIGPRSSTINRMACSPKHKDLRIRLPQDGPSPLPYLTSHCHALPTGPGIPSRSAVKGTYRPNSTCSDALGMDAPVISKVAVTATAAATVATSSVGSRMTPKAFRRIHSLVSSKDQGSLSSVIPPSILDSDEAAPMAKACVSRIHSRPPLAQNSGRITACESEGHDGGKIKRTRIRASNTNPYKRTATTAGTSSSKKAPAEVETLRGALGSMKLSN